MTNKFGTDMLIQAPDPKAAAKFYVEQLGFSIDDTNPGMIGLHGENINLFIEPEPALGPVLEDHGRRCRRSQAQVGRARLRDREG